MEVVVGLPLPKGAHILSYADDLVLVVTSRVANKVATAQRALDLVSTACSDLGLKVSADKSRAMTLCHQGPRRSLRIQGTPLTWVSEHKYLGIWVDQNLTFKREVEYLRERVRDRLAVMRALSGPKAGATTGVLRLFYAQAIRPLIDYAAPALVAASAQRLTTLDKLQRAALRIILGAPKWTHVGTMEEETGLIPIHLRVQQLVAGRVATILQRSHYAITCRTLGRMGNYLRKSEWVRKTAEAFTTLIPHWETLTVEDDLPDPAYTQPPPWSPPAVETRVTSLPGTKAQCSASEQRQHALQNIHQLYSPGAGVYYTDGSVDPDSGRAGAAFVVEGRATAWRVSDQSSSLQAELAAIHGALAHALEQDDNSVVIHTDSLSAVMVLRRPRPVDNVQLTTAILGLAQSLTAIGKTVLVNWVPGHVGLAGNDAADLAARDGAAMPVVAHHLRPSLASSRALAKSAVSAAAHSRHLQQATHSASMRWYLRAAQGTRISPEINKNRGDSVAAHRLRLGYRTYRERVPGRGDTVCTHCSAMTPSPLRHYLLQCPATASVRATVSQQLPVDSTELAIACVRQLCDNPALLRAMVQDAPPPR